MIISAKEYSNDDRFHNAEAVLQDGDMFSGGKVVKVDFPVKGVARIEVTTEFDHNVKIWRDENAEVLQVAG